MSAMAERARNSASNGSSFPRGFAADEAGQLRKRVAPFGARLRGRRGGAQATFELVQIDLRTKLGGKLTHGQPSRIHAKQPEGAPISRRAYALVSASRPAR